MTYDIATNLVTQAPDLGKLTQAPWSQVTESGKWTLRFSI